MKVVFDTNIFISAFILPGSQGEQAFLLARREVFDLYSSIAILTETAKTLRAKFEQSDEDIKASLQIISRAAILVKPSRNVTVLSDAPDNRILECALEAEADLIVTGDRHLLKMKRFQEIPIIRLADFLRLFPHAP
jgi:putative PIN family toxin of toxin-antitoxin system